MADYRPYSTVAFNRKTNHYEVVYQDWPYTKLGEQCAIQACKEFVSSISQAYNEKDWQFVALRGNHIELGDLV